MVETIITIVIGLIILRFISPDSYTKIKEGVNLKSSLKDFNKNLSKIIDEIDQGIEFDEKEWSNFLKRNTKDSNTTQIKEDFSIGNKFENDELKNYIEQKDIKKLIHFTDSRNLESILKYGLLSKNELDRLNFTYKFNDDKRLDGCLDFISLSVTKPNIFLLQSFLKRRIILNPILLEIDVSMLWKENNDRIYCQTNAATKYSKKGSHFNDFKAMFSEVVSY